MNQCYANYNQILQFFNCCMQSVSRPTCVDKQPSTAQRDDAKFQKAQTTSSPNPFYYYVSPSNKQSAVLKNSIPKQSEQQSPRSRSRDKKHKDYKHKQIHKNSAQRKSHFHSKKSNNRDSVQNPMEETYFKTKLCPLFQKGQCKKGYNCSYAHGEKQLRLLPNLKKTKLCIAFKQGKCGKPSSECRYAHGESQLRRAQNKEMQSKRSRSPPRKSQNPQKLNMAYMISPSVNTPQSLSNGYVTYPPSCYLPYPTTGNNYPPLGNTYPPSMNSYPSSGNVYPPAGNSYGRNPQGNSYSGYPPMPLPITYPPGSFMPGTMSGTMSGTIPATMPSNYYYHGSGETVYPYTPYGNNYPPMPSKDKQFY